MVCTALTLLRSAVQTQLQLVSVRLAGSARLGSCRVYDVLLTDSLLKNVGKLILCCFTADPMAAVGSVSVSLLHSSLSAASDNSWWNKDGNQTRAWNCFLFWLPWEGAEMTDGWNTNDSSNWPLPARLVHVSLGSRCFPGETISQTNKPRDWGFSTKLGGGLCCYPLLLPSTATLVSWPAALQITASDPKGFEISFPHIYY